MAIVELTLDIVTRHLNNLPIPRWIRFVVGGGINTAVTYFLYLVLSQFLNYQLAFLFAFIIGIVSSYLFNTIFVFRTVLSWRAMIIYPIVYLPQYIISAIGLGLLVEELRISKLVAPLALAAASLPLTYLLSKLVILRPESKNLPKQNREAVNGRMSQNFTAILAPSILVTALLWIPFGPSMMGLIEEWDLLGLFNISGLFYYVHADGPIAFHALRPLMPLTFAVAYFLDRNSFTYWHVLLFVSLVVKGSALGYLIGKATRSRLIAVFIAVLFLLYPADTMQLSFRSLHINWASALGLLAAAILYASFSIRQRSMAYAASVTATLLFFLGCCMYEATLTVLPLPILLLCVRNGIRDGLVKLRLNALPACIWMLGAVAYGMFAIQAVRAAGTYQGSIASHKNIFRFLLDALPQLFAVGAMRALYGGWIDAAVIFTKEYNDYSYILIGVSTVFVLTAFIICRPKNTMHVSVECGFWTHWTALRLISVGLLSMLLGYTPFLISSVHVGITQRTYIWATPGAAIAWVGMLMWLSRYTRLGSIVFVVLLTTLGLSAQLFQFHHYVKISDIQRRILKEIVEKFDGDADGKTLVILDEANSTGHIWTFPDDGLRYALSYLYGHNIKEIQICHHDNMEWQRADSLGRKGTCVENNGDWTFQYPPPVSGPGYTPPLAREQEIARKENAVVVSIGASNYAPSAAPLSAYRVSLERAETTVARRYRGNLKATPWPISLSMFKNDIVSDRYRWDFGDYWSLESPTWGSGWRQAEWQITPFRQNAVAWSVREDAHLFFNFSPEKDDYRLRARYPAFSKGVLKEQLQIDLNGVVLTPCWVSEEIVQADIPASTLRSGRNQITLKLPVNNTYFGLGAQMDFFEVFRSDK